MSDETDWVAWYARSQASIRSAFSIPEPQLGEPPRWIEVQHRADYGVTVCAQFHHSLVTAWAPYADGSDPWRKRKTKISPIREDQPMSKTATPARCNCGKPFTCAKCGKRVWCDPDVNMHGLKICKTCCAAEGIKAIIAGHKAAADAAKAAITAAPAELAITRSPRVGMMERADTEEIIRNAWAEGRLSDEIYDARMDAAAKAIHQADLDMLTVDITPADPGPIHHPAPRGDRVLATIARAPNWGLIIILLLLAAAMFTGH